MTRYNKVEALRATSGGEKQYVLTGSAVELSMMGNEDMLARDEMARRRAQASAKGAWNGDNLGITIDPTKTPPALYGMTELPLDSPADLRKMYKAISTRNTAGTGMNDSSSRSHCFAVLMLHVHDAKTATVRTSRFQMVDLAGSERLKDAHGGSKSPFAGGFGPENQALNGVVTNYGLMLLSSCARALLEARRRKRPFSFRAYLHDLPLLLQDSMTGAAATACFVCLSQAPDNTLQSKYALDFGEVFAKLSAKPVRAPAVPLTKILKPLTGLLTEAERKLAGPGPKSGGNRYAMLRLGQAKHCEQRLAVMKRFEG